MRSVLSLAAAFVIAAGAAEDCDRRRHGFSSFVCACNAARCDTPAPLSLEDLPRDRYVVYTSSMSRDRLRRREGHLSRTPPAARSGVASLLVDSSDLRHEILGFGGAMTDSAAINIATLSFRAQQKLLSAYFSPEGSQYSIVRLPIAGSDFSTHEYTYDDVANDTQLEHFYLTPEDLRLRIPYLHWARSMSARGVKLLGSVWTAPAWMKSSPKRLLPENYQLWADYILRFVEAYAAVGLPVWALTGQNEPVMGASEEVNFNSMAWTSQEQAAWISRNLGPSLRRAGHSDISVFVLDDQRPYMEEWAAVMFGNSSVSQYVAGMAVHWYYDRSSDPDIISQVHQQHPDKLLIYTEACDGPFMSPGPAVQLGSWERGENYTSDIIQVVSRGVSAWVDWNLALDGTGGPNWAQNYVDSPVIVNAVADEFYKQPTYYSLAHFSRYVPPGSRCVGVRARGSYGLEHVAFLTPDKATVIVLQNRQGEDIETVITDVKAGSIHLTVPARSMHTIIYKS